MAEKLFPQQEDGGRAYGLDPLRAAVIMLSVCRHYKITMKDLECYRLCNALCLPHMMKEEFLNYWADFLREVSFLKVYVFKVFFPEIPEYSTHVCRLCLAVCICCSNI